MDVDHYTMVKQPIQDGRGEHLIPNTSTERECMSGVFARFTL